MGFEPTASRATIWRANQLRYTHHKYKLFQKGEIKTSLRGFEPMTYGLEGRCSIQLSYRLIHITVYMFGFVKPKRVMGIEPT